MTFQRNIGSGKGPRTETMKCAYPESSRTITYLLLLRYIHRVTKARSALRPEERGGGILADEMGMGKSLCVLALILDTLEKGHEWAQQRHSEAFRSSKVQKCSRSTLIIVPSARK